MPILGSILDHAANREQALLELVGDVIRPDRWKQMTPTGEVSSANIPAKGPMSGGGGKAFSPNRGKKTQDQIDASPNVKDLTFRKEMNQADKDFAAAGFKTKGSILDSAPKDRSKMSDAEWRAAVRADFDKGTPGWQKAKEPPSHLQQLKDQVKWTRFAKENDMPVDRVVAGTQGLRDKWGMTDNEIKFYWQKLKQDKGF